jgi:hypothetical protein
MRMCGEGGGAAEEGEHEGDEVELVGSLAEVMPLK